MGNKKLVIAVDNSKACLKALDFALEHFPTGYSYHLVHMQPRPYASPFVADESAAPEYDYESMRSAEMTAAAASNKFLEEVFVPKAKSAGADVFAMVLPVDSDSSSQIGAAICEYADKTKADALIMMRQNKSAVERFFMGSVTRYCAVHSPTPVITPTVPEGPANTRFMGNILGVPEPSSADLKTV